MTECAADEICAFRRERKFTRHAANAVGSEKLSWSGDVIVVWRIDRG